MINAERSFMFSACAGVSSIASHTLAKRFLLIDLAPLTNPGNAAPLGSDPFYSFSASSSEAMQHVNGIIELRHIQHSECSRGIANPNFPHPSANRIHGLPVVRLAPTLDLVELISCLTPGRCRKCTQIVERTASEFNGLRFDHRT